MTYHLPVILDAARTEFAKGDLFFPLYFNSLDPQDWTPDKVRLGRALRERDRRRHRGVYRHIFARRQGDGSSTCVVDRGGAPGHLRQRTKANRWPAGACEIHGPTGTRLSYPSFSFVPRGSLAAPEISGNWRET
jgi:hypothetical protein